MLHALVTIGAAGAHHERGMVRTFQAPIFRRESVPGWMIPFALHSRWRRAYSGALPNVSGSR